MKTKLLLIALIFSFACGTKYDGPGIDPIYPTSTSCTDIQSLDYYSGSIANVYLELALEDTKISGSYLNFVTINARLSIGGDTYCCGRTQAGALVLNNGSFNYVGFKAGDYGALTQQNLFCLPISPYSYSNVSLIIVPQNNLTSYMYLTNNKRLNGHIIIIVNNVPSNLIYLQ